MPCRFILPEKAKRAEKAGTLLPPAPPPASPLRRAPTLPQVRGNRLRARRHHLPQLQRMESAQASVIQRLDVVEQWQQAPVSRAPPQPVPSPAAAVGALNPAAFGDVGPGVAVGGKGRE
eukprot:gene32597-12143_t